MSSSASACPEDRNNPAAPALPGDAGSAVPASRFGPAAMAPRAAWSRHSYRRLLAWAFAFFNAVRLLSYLPTMWAIFEQGDSSQHSLLTWGTWFGANLTMAAWLHENGAHRIDGPVLINLGNAVACGLTMVLIAVMRL